jgi:hypothetical protein
MSVGPDALVWIRQHRLILYQGRLDCFIFQIGITQILAEKNKLFGYEGSTARQGLPEGAPCFFMLVRTTHIG